MDSSPQRLRRAANAYVLPPRAIGSSVPAYEFDEGVRGADPAK